MSDQEISVEDFLNLQEVSATLSSVSHKEAAQATHLIEYAKSRKHAPFKILDWIEKGKADGVITDELAKKYKKLQIWGIYKVQSGKNKGNSAFYSGTTVFTALKKSITEKYFIVVREDTILIVPEASFAKIKVNLKKTAKGKALLKTFQTNFEYMYNGVKPPLPKTVVTEPTE